ncbi:MAG: endonuclease MutS2 [Erysipelotrichaceae bacterium]
MNRAYDVLEFNEILNEVAGHCRFSLGADLILSSTPQFNRLWVERELKRTQEAMDSINVSGSMPFGGISDIRMPLLESQKDQILAIPDLLAIARHGQAVHTIKEYLRKSEVKGEEISDIVASMRESIELSNAIEACFSPSYEVLDSASTQLKHIRRQMRLNAQELNKTSEHFIQKNAAKLTDTISTIRNDRVVVLARISDKNSFGGILHGESASGQTAYIEPPVLVELNNKAQELKIAEGEEIKRICYELSQKTKVHAEEYLANLASLSLLDAIYAKARFGIDRKGVTAKITDERNLSYENARHPLIDPLRVVANSYHMTSDKPTLLITGPNTGGKTVSLKILGLFTIMTYCGMPVLADEAILPMFDQVFVDIGDDQSIQASLSTFSAHLQKIATICQQATGKSLILLDELGGGTDPVEGESLAMAVLNELRSRKAMIAATTHYSKLKAYGSKHADILLASVQFDLEKLQPTYRYIEGLPGSSNALAIAEKFGLSAKIVAEAREIKNAAKTVEELRLEELEAAIYLHKQKEDVLKTKISALEEATLAADKERIKYETQKEKILEDARKEGRELVSDLRAEAQELLDEIREAQKTNTLHVAIEKKFQLDKLDETKEEDDDIPLDKPEIGQWVKIKHTSQTGQIIAVKRKLITMNVNGVRLDVPLDKVTKAHAPAEKKKKVSSVSYEMPAMMSMELNIIGLRVEEALPLVDKYLDDCIRSRLNNVRIIHGHGTGALRSAVHQYLKLNSQVAGYRLGGQGEGGVGATVVAFKGL